MRYLIYTVAFLFYAIGAHAASFDCSKASIWVEKAICSDAKLSELDDSLFKAYKNALASSSDAPALKSEQRAWLKEVRNKCTDAPCLNHVFDDRLKALAGTTTSIPVVSNTSESSVSPANTASDVQPCFVGVCLNDSAQDIVEKANWFDISALIKKHLHSATGTKPPEAKYMGDFVAKNVRGTLTKDHRLKISDYLASGVFDKNFLKLVAQVKPIFCKPLERGLMGTFKDANGHITTAYGNFDSNSMFRIYQISRQWDSGDAVETANFKKALCEKYSFTCKTSWYDETMNGSKDLHTYNDIQFTISYNFPTLKFDEVNNNPNKEVPANWTKQSGCEDTVRKPIL